MNCNGHCRTCDTCFSGTTPFDKHRHDFKCEDPAEHGLHPHIGVCEVSDPPKVRRGREVWSSVEARA